MILTKLCIVLFIEYKNFEVKIDSKMHMLFGKNGNDDLIKTGKKYLF